VTVLILEIETSQEFTT